MSTVTHSSVLKDQQNRVQHSSGNKQKSDDYVLRMAACNIRNALQSRGFSGQMPADMSGSTQHLPDKCKQGSSNVARIDSKEIVPPNGDLVLMRAKAKLERTLTPTSEWEGYVESVSEDEFSVRLVNVRSQSGLPVDQATFHKDDVSEFDQELLREGAIIRWVIGRERLSTGQVRNVSELHFRRLPSHSKKDYKRAYEKACNVLEGINWDNEAEE